MSNYKYSDYKALSFTATEATYDVGTVLGEYFEAKEMLLFATENCTVRFGINGKAEYIHKETYFTSKAKCDRIFVTRDTADGVLEIWSEGDKSVTSLLYFSQSGVGSDWAGTILTLDGATYTRATLPYVLKVKIGTRHTFTFGASLAGGTYTYVWSETKPLGAVRTQSFIATRRMNFKGIYVVS